MRARAAVVMVLVVVLAGLSLAGPLSQTARGETLPPPKLYVTVWAGTGAQLVFTPNVITIPQLPTVVNVTVKNVDTTAGMQHTFTIRTTAGQTDYLVNTGFILPGQQTTVEFEVVAADRIVSGARNTTVETSGGHIKFFCIPHEGANMVGSIVLASATAPAVEPEKGVFLRAYWIGLLGIAGTLVLIGAAYFVVKSSSPHFRDHHEHIRRGGP